MMGMVTFDYHVNALERYWKGDISSVIKGLLSRSACHGNVIRNTEEAV